MRSFILLLFLISSTSAVFAQEGPADGSSSENDPVNETSVSDPEEKENPNKWEMLLQYSQEQLSNGYGTWKTGAVTVERRTGRQQILWGTYRVSERRSMRDQEFIAGMYRRFENKWAFTAEGMYSPTNKFVGKFSVMGEIEKDLGKGYVAHAGSRYTSYNNAVKATSVYGLMEKYWGNNRAAYTLYLTKLSNAGTAPSHRIQYNRYFGERVNSIGTSFSWGREHENLGPDIGILRNNTWSTSVSGRFWVTKNIGVNVDGWLHRQGDIYYRGGVNVGTRIRF
ncbi:MAG: YaiO family outer membrane beta-barrel protein [Acidobacteria bacterium]|nr:YaiO family outer membrane beta-barrel protein [Acidobacteriota bacterium]